MFEFSEAGQPKRKIEVPATTLMNIMDEYSLSQIDFLKLDCEGSEGAIFASTPREYLRRIRKISLEFHDNVSSLRHEEIQRLLEDMEFQTALRWNGKSPYGYLYAGQP